MNFLAYFPSLIKVITTVAQFGMKTLILILVLTMSAQPLQAGACDMDMSQESSHHSGQTEDSGHDCCETGDPESPQQDCDGNMHCGFCNANLPALQALLKVSSPWPHPQVQSLDSGEVLPSHSSPPFRPPIS
jgi:hypothetical protein